MTKLIQQENPELGSQGEFDRPRYWTMATKTLIIFKRRHHVPPRYTEARRITDLAEDDKGSGKPRRLDLYLTWKTSLPMIRTIRLINMPLILPP